MHSKHVCENEIVQNMQIDYCYLKNIQIARIYLLKIIRNSVMK